MGSRRSDFFQEAAVGVFMAAVIALLAYFTIVISGVDVLQGRKKAVATVFFGDVGGLKDRDSVMYRGSKVGSVSSIEILPDGLRVKMEIDRRVVLRKSYRISVCSLSMLGGNYLLLEEGEGDPLPLETSEFRGETPTDWMRDVSNIAKKVNELVSDGAVKEIVGSFRDVGANLKATTDRIERGEGTLGKLLSSDETVYSDAKSIVSNLASVAESVRAGKGTLGKLLSEDDTLYRHLEKTLADASEIAGRLKAGEGFLGRLLAKDDPLYGEFNDAVKAFREACGTFDATKAVAGAERLVDTLNAVADRLKNGEGTLGKLLAEEGLYDDVRGLAKDVRQVLDNFRDTTPISTFGSLIMGGL